MCLCVCSWLTFFAHHHHSRRRRIFERKYHYHHQVSYNIYQASKKNDSSQQAIKKNDGKERNTQENLNAAMYVCCVCIDEQWKKRVSVIGKDNNIERNRQRQTTTIFEFDFISFFYILIISLFLFVYVSVFRFKLPKIIHFDIFLFRRIYFQICVSIIIILFLDTRGRERENHFFFV